MTDTEHPPTRPARSDERHSGRFELGLHTFGDVTRDPDGRRLSHPEVLRDLLSQARLADEVGVDVFGVGEHHRPDFAVSAPDIVLSAIGAATERIKLISAVTVLSSDDPVRVYQRFATLDGLTDGRAEVSLGRGSFVESFPLFGYELSDYDQLFEEKTELFAALRREGPVSWSGRTRTGLSSQRIYPTTDHEHGLPTWIAVGGTPNSAVRAARHGAGLELAIIGGAPERFAPIAELYRRALPEFGHTEPRRVAVHSHGFVADSDEEAAETFYPAWAEAMGRIGRERGWGREDPPRSQFDQEVAQGSLYVGSPETVARKIVSTSRALGATRFGMKYGNASLSHEAMMSAIDLYGRKVGPLVREMLDED
ncbi:LLM class flavin-dependent oxidoreductase [Nesterenkonia marinintestina]|uniref:LLM class flavin-dependent oxidoreductase n=1 Tax=Nesterenkonia marinintestina TaxID=2979865 RepID=UPI0021C09682|nr:LLM class flavin-dependent oxidoreductase [Nesterenkonia sp. GX14115]